MTEAKFNTARKYFEEFRDAHAEAYREAVRNYRVKPQGGYPPFYRDSEVITCMYSLYGNMTDGLADLRYPKVWPTMDSIIQAWHALREYLIGFDELFDDIELHFSTDRSTKITSSSVVDAVNKHRNDAIKMLDHILKEVPSIAIDELEHFDVVIITAVYESEFVALMSALPDIQPYQGDGTKAVYRVASLMNGARSLRVLLACANQMGMPAASTLATKLILRHRPALVAMCGICAGVKGSIGDVLVPEVVWDYGSGKRTAVKRKNAAGEDELVEEFRPYPSQEWIVAKYEKPLVELAHERHYLDEIRNAYNKDRSWPEFPSTLSMQHGPYASGAAVIASDKLKTEIKGQHGKLIGFDMEAYGVVYACKNASPKQPVCVIVKSISDYGDPSKDTDDKDAHQAFAAHTSSRYLLQLITHQLILEEAE